MNNGVVDVSDLLNPDSIFPDDVIKLYKWKNRVNTNPGNAIGNLWLFPMGIFLPFKRAMEIHSYMTKQEYGWDKDKFPLFESGGGEYFLIECNSDRPTHGMIFLHSAGAVEFDTLISYYDSLKTLF